MEAVSTSSVTAPKRSCVGCSDRKVKCDRQRPCDACIKRKVQCVFPEGRPTRKTRRSRADSPNSRLNRLEAALRRQGISHSDALRDILGPDYHKANAPTIVPPEAGPQPLTPASVNSESLRSLTTTQLVRGADTGHSTFVDNSLWSRVVEEIHESDQDLEEETPSEESDQEASDDGYSFVLGTTQANPTSPWSHPPPEHLLQLWQIFIDNFDPLTKIVHVPTIQPAVEKASRDIESVPRAFHALLFAIYTAAVMSLKDSECKRSLGQSRKSLMTYYSSATRAALSRVRFMKTSNIVILQALVIYLVAVREVYEPRLIWVLTGVAIRIAECMGLQRDGTYLGLPPFETEIRRRIWWQLKMHDFRTAELSGVAKFQGIAPGAHPPKPLINVNDNELYPDMPTAPVDSTGPTDMVFCVLRSQLGAFAANHADKFTQNGGSGGLWNDYTPARDTQEKDAVIEQLKEVFELKYLRHCDPSQPLQLLTLLFARSAIHVGHFVSHHPRRWASIEQIPESEQDYVWDLSIKLLNIHDMMQSDRRLKCFSWYASYYTQWHAFIHVLDTLRARPVMKGADQAWQLVEATYENNPAWISNTNRPIHVAVGNLCLKAFNTREATLINDGKSVGDLPQFIIKLRHQRQAAKIRRQEREMDRRRAPPTSDREPPKVDASTSSTDPEPSFARQSSGAQQDWPSQLNDHFDQPTDFSNSNDALWYGSGYESRVSGQFNDGMITDVDYMLAQDQGFEESSTSEQGISWSQWDAWLADSGGMSLSDASFGMSFDSGPV